MAKRIRLGGKILSYTLVDDNLFDYLNQWRWTISSQGYAVRRARLRSGKYRTILMHRLIASAPTGMVVDHINSNKLDNRLNNLRVCSQRENSSNRKSLNKNNTHGYRGVRYDGRQPCRPWIAQIMVNRKNIYLYSHKTKEEAALAYNKAAKKYHGKFATLNEVKYG